MLDLELHNVRNVKVDIKPTEVEQSTTQFDTVNHRVVEGTKECFEFLV